MSNDVARHLMVDFTQMKTFAEDPLVLEHGEGIRVTDDRGRTYIDGLSGVFTSNLGHGNPEITDALASQARRLAFGAPTMGTNTRAAELVEQLLRLVPADFTTVKLLSGGSEANEAAIKLARQFHKQTGHATKYKVVSHYRGYHGGTGNALAASGWAHWKNAFEPMPGGFVHLQTPDTDSPLHPGLSGDEMAEVYGRLLRATIELEGPETIAAIITEPILMSAGVVVPPDRYMLALREVCDEYNILLVFDEIITGFGRTGKWFAAEHPGVWPDIFCCGKGVTGGYSPLSIVFMTQRVAEPFWGEPGSQFFAGHTYGGNPVACAAGLAALEYMQAYDVVGQSERTGAYLRTRLDELAASDASRGLVRGRGMLQAIVFDANTHAPDPRRRIGLDVALEARRRGLLLRAAPWFVAVAPPLVSTREDVDTIVDILRAALAAFDDLMSALVMVWDGLRPDFVSAEWTPNLWRLAQQGVWFERSHAVYPTLTRANSPAISTGCRPGAAGVPGNSFCLPSANGPVEYNTGDAANLQRLADADGRPVVLVDTLADRVHRTGGTTVVVGSGSPGSALLQHPRYVESGDFVISAATLQTGQVREAMLARFGAPPRRRLPATEWDAYFTRIITDFVLPEVSPTLLVFWHTDPDHTSHARGHRAAETLRSLQDADDNLGAILETYERLGLRSSTSVVVTSDHGSSTINRRVQPTQDLAPLLAESAVADNGGSVFVYTSDPAAVSAIRTLDYAGPIFTRDGREQTFPLRLVGLDGPRAPDIVFSLDWSDAAVDSVPGVASGTHAKLAVDHGTISPFELRNTLVCEGPDFRIGWQDPAPVGNIDIAPTLAQVLRLEPGTPFEGRVLEEALRDAPAAPPTWETYEQATTFSARGSAWTQRVWFEAVYSHAYLTGGAVERI